MILMELEIKVGFPIKNLKTGLKMKLFFRTLTFLFLFSCEAKNDSDVNGASDESYQEYNTRKEVPVDENGVVQNPIYLADNGITVKARDWAFVGDSGMLDDVEYIIISRQQLRSKIVNGEDVTKICTSRLVYLSGMLRGMQSFNQNISHWDTSNVINMNQMLYGAASFNQDIGGWNTSNLVDMSQMFQNAGSFNQDLSSWSVTNVTSCDGFDLFASDWTLPKPNFTNCVP